MLSVYTSEAPSVLPYVLWQKCYEVPQGSVLGSLLFMLFALVNIRNHKFYISNQVSHGLVYTFLQHETYYETYYFRLKKVSDC